MFLIQGALLKVSTVLVCFYIALLLPKTTAKNKDWRNLLELQINRGIYIKRDSIN
jgi:hypothetical protein